MKLVSAIALGAFLIVGLNVNAQTEKSRKDEPAKKVTSLQKLEVSPEKQGEARAKRLSEKVDLSEEQFEKVKVLFTNIETKNKGVRENANISSEQKQEIIKSNNDYEQRALKDILTPEQLKKLDTAQPANSNSVK